MEFRSIEFAEHASFGWQPSTNQRRSLKLILRFVLSKQSAVILIWFLSLFLLKLPQGLHLLWRLSDYRCQIHFFSLGFFFQSWKFFHQLVVLMPLLDEVIAVGSKQSIDL